MTIATQAPASGCEDCGAPVRTRKYDRDGILRWVCWQCARRPDYGQCPACGTRDRGRDFCHRCGWCVDADPLARIRWG